MGSVCATYANERGAGCCIAVLLDVTEMAVTIPTVRFDTGRPVERVVVTID